jgi:hypothetical protein
MEVFITPRVLLVGSWGSDRRVLDSFLGEDS